MVKTPALFDSTHGSIYLIPYEDGNFILAQVGLGGDLGVFDALVSPAENLLDLDPNMIFRVHYGRLSPKKWNWLSLGMLPYKRRLSLPYPYLQRAVGSDECYVVRYGCDDCPVSCENGREYEPLATWSHEHIVGRFRKSRNI